LLGFLLFYGGQELLDGGAHRGFLSHPVLTPLFVGFGPFDRGLYVGHSFHLPDPFRWVSTYNTLNSIMQGCKKQDGNKPGPMMEKMEAKL
jgi:hypothetical protein